MLIYIFPIIKLHARSSSAVQGGLIGIFVKIGNSFIQPGDMKIYFTILYNVLFTQEYL